MMKRHAVPLVVVGGLFVVACGGLTQEFAPLQADGGYTIYGYRSGTYDVAIEGSKVGEVEVWSAGAFEDEAQAGEPTMLHVGLSVKGVGEEPLMLSADAVELTTLVVDDRTIEAPGIDPITEEGVVPKAEGQVDVFFRLPPDVDPQDVDAFRVRWKVQSEAGEYAEVTPFVEYDTGYYSPYYTDYYPGYRSSWWYYDGYPYYYPYGGATYGRYNFPRQEALEERGR